MEYTTFFISKVHDFNIRRLNSFSIDCDKEPVLYRFRYVPPYETFHEIKKIQLLMHRKAAERSANTLTVDLTEWLDHTNEEYFTAAMQFLADFADAYQPQFLLISSSEKQMQRIQMHLQCYFSVNTVFDRCFDEIAETHRYISAHCPIAASTGKELAHYIVKSDFPRSYLILDRMIDEIRMLSNGSQITKRTLQQVKQIASPATAMLLNAMDGLDKAG